MCHQKSCQAAYPRLSGRGWDRYGKKRRLHWHNSTATDCHRPPAIRFHQRVNNPDPAKISSDLDRPPQRIVPHVPVALRAVPWKAQADTERQAGFGSCPESILNEISSNSLAHADEDRIGYKITSLAEIRVADNFGTNSIQRDTLSRSPAGAVECQSEHACATSRVLVIRVCSQDTAWE